MVDERQRSERNGKYKREKQGEEEEEKRERSNGKG